MAAVMSTTCEALIDALRDEFDLAGQEPVAFIRELGARVRRLEDALGSDRYLCPDCGADATAQVLDAMVGAVWVAPSCSCGEDAMMRINSMALERHRLAEILGGDGGQGVEVPDGVA